MQADTIPVTKTFLPPREEFDRILNRAWESRWLTNRGPLVIELEKKICQVLSNSNLLFVANGTLALQIMIRAFVPRGAEIITTPFSYVATVSSAIWEGYKIVFADVDPKTGNIDPEQVKKKITKNTKAILATHVFGNPCRVVELEEIAKENKLAVLYDAAHAFGVTIQGRSILQFGDSSILSFHATKIFHTVEGGAIACKDSSVLQKCYYLHNFGHQSAEEFCEVGINAKASEFHAAMGLANLPHFEEIKMRRKEISNLYKKHLGTAVSYPEILNGCDYNFSYFPVFFKSEEELLAVRECLQSKNIFPRRYFYPSLNTLPYLEYEKMPVSEDLSRRVLCLPLYHDLSHDIVVRIAQIVLSKVGT